MKTEFCVIGSDYVTEGGKPAVRLWGRTKSGKSILAVDRGFRPYFYAHFEGNGNEFREKAMKLEIDGEKPSKVEVVERNILGRPSKLLKITVTLPPSVPKFRELVKEWKGVKEEYEYSIPFHKRYMIDNDISPMGWVEAEGRAVDGPADINIELESVRNLDGPIADPKVFRLLAFRVLNGKSSLKIEAAGTGPARTITGKRAVEEFVSLVKRADPDFIIGYGSDRGDFPALSSHALEKKEGLALGRDGSKVAFTKRAYYSSAEVEGRCHIDILDFVENIMASGLSAETTSIEDVGSELLGRKAGNSAETILKLGELLLPQIFEISNLVGQSPFDASRMAYSQLVESLLMREAFRSGEVILNRPRADEIEKRRRAPTYEGGYVKTPTPGIHDNIALFDFASLYPSITITHNISPESLDCDCCRNEEKASVPELDHYFCTKKRGFIPKILQGLVLKRSELKAMMKKERKGSAAYNELHNRQYAMKIIANASYGYYGYPGSRWYSRIAAECITAWGRHYIKKLIGVAEKMGYAVIYGDTDSIFIKVRDGSDAMKFLYKANSTLPGVMELDFQGIYKSGIFVSTKTGAAAKKRYALLDSKGNMVIRGFEKVRRDWSVIAKDTQEAVLRHVLADKSPEKAVNAVRTSIEVLRSGKAKLSDLVIYTQLTKPLSEYGQVSPHVSAARKMEKSGIGVGEGTNIAYIITKGEGSISERAEPFGTAKSYDAEYYINNQVLPAALRVLSTLGYTEDDILKGGAGQSSLSSFSKTKRRQSR